ncbi:MAG: sugar phosphate isomerase/epimerase family protein [Spirochaetota bacterium]
MKFGINTFLFASPFKTSDLKLFRDFKEMGFDGVEIALEEEGDLDYRKALAALKDHGLTCCAVCGTYGTGRDLRGSKTEQQEAKRYIRECIDACCALECDIFAGPHYSRVGRAKPETAQAKSEQWKRVVANLQELGSDAKKQGVCLALEPMNRFATDFLNTCEQTLKLIEDVGSPMIKVHLDTFHMNIEEKNPCMAILDAGEHLYHLHVSENDRGTPGTGCINWKAIKDALVKINYDRYVAIESFSPDIGVSASAASIWRKIEKSNVDLASKGLYFLKGLFGQ